MNLMRFSANFMGDLLSHQKTEHGFFVFKINWVLSHG